MRYDDSGLADHFLNEIIEQISIEFRLIVDGWTVGEAKPQQIQSIDTK